MLKELRNSATKVNYFNKHIDTITSLLFAEIFHKINKRTCEIACLEHKASLTSFTSFNLSSKVRYQYSLGNLSNLDSVKTY